MTASDDDIRQVGARMKTSLTLLGAQEGLSLENKERLAGILSDVDLLLSFVPPPVLPFSPKNTDSAGRPVILIVDNNAGTQEFLHENLAEEYAMVHIRQAAEALERVREINPDIIITDILLPDLRGDLMCRQLKSSIETSHIPVFFLTALDDKEYIMMGLESGADDYITKPCDTGVLKARLRNVLLNREKFRHTLLASEPDPGDASYANSLDKAFLDKAVRVIENELSNPAFSINEFCRAIGMSRTSVYNKLKNLTGQGPNDFIRIIRLKNAHELLRSRRHPVVEVSLMVGFADAKYFSTCFKKQFGVSPSKIK